MAISDYGEMNAMEMDIMKEIGSIGTGNAATALSGLLGCEVRMSLPAVSVLGYNQAVEALGDAEEIVAAVMVQMDGEVSGIMLFILHVKLVNVIIGKLLDRRIDNYEQLEDMDVSALEEVGNIMISSYINAMSKLAGVDINLSVPDIAINMLGGILSVPMAEFGYQTDKLMMIRGSFMIEGEELKSNLLMLPDISSLNYLMAKLVSSNE